MEESAIYILTGFVKTCMLLDMTSDKVNFKKIWEVDTELRMIIIPASIFCPYCGHRHIDNLYWVKKSHVTHLCMNCNKKFNVTVKGN